MLENVQIAIVCFTHAYKLLRFSFCKILFFLLEQCKHFTLHMPQAAVGRVHRLLRKHFPHLVYSEIFRMPVRSPGHCHWQPSFFSARPEFRDWFDQLFAFN